MKLDFSIQKEGLLLRPLNKHDLEETLSWRNRDGVRQCFFYDKIITLEEHYGWYENYLKKMDDIVLIGEIDGEKIGQLAVYDIKNKQAEIGRFIVSPLFSGKGMMRKLMLLLCEVCAKNGLDEVYLEVLSSNVRAIELYESIGFITVCSTSLSMRMSKSLGV